MKDLTVSMFGIGVLAFCVGVGLTLIWARQAIALARVREQQRVSAEYEGSIRDLSAQLAGAMERHAASEKALRDSESSFKSLSAEALRENNRSFLEMAQAALARVAEGSQSDLQRRQDAIAALVNPVREALSTMDSKLGELEKSRVGAYESLRTIVGGLDETQKALRSETGNLVRALHSPVVRGRWGEIQLRRVVELAGMSEHCDFYEQESVEVEGGRQRPDMRVQLPGGQSVIVDSKVPLAGYLDAVQAGDESARKGGLGRHAAQVRSHVEQLSRKGYWEQFEATPEFVVLFLPGEVFFSAALEEDPELIAYAAERRIVLASPTTLIALLRAVHYGWRQEAVAKNAEQISALGRELHKRLGDFAGHMARVGQSLGSAVDHFNRASGSLESRVLVSARRFEEFKAANAGAAIPELAGVDKLPAGTRATGTEGSPPNALPFS